MTEHSALVWLTPATAAQLKVAVVGYIHEVRRRGGTVTPDVEQLARRLSVAAGTSAKPTPPRPWLSPGEVAPLLGVSERTVYRRIADGTLPSRRFGGLRQVHVSAITGQPLTGDASGEG